MNMHGPQNVMAETELKHLASTVSQIITPASNSPIIGMYQDSLLGAFRFTREKIDLTPRQAMNLLMAYKNIDVDALVALEGKITNFDILSQIMPHITMTVKNKLIGENEDFATSNNVMEIRDGKYIRGQMEKSVLGATTNGIIHRAFNDFGPDRAAEFIDDLQAVVTEYMKTSSYSVGISDLLADNTTMTQITSTIATQKMEAKKLMDSVHLGIFKNETAYSNAAEFENQITNIMKKADNDAGKIGSKSLSKNNRFLMIVNSGSKGNMINISQMISCLGQQAVEGKRIPYGLDSRTLPHYFKYDDSPGARGYIENSYISGLTAPELFFHAMGGRIGLIDTAVKTSSTGYIQRRLIKGLEDLKVEYDMTVRNSNGKIIQFAYGDDGFDSTKVENQQIPLVGMSVEDVYMMYDIARITDKERGSKDIYTPAIVNKIRGEVEETRKMCRQYIDRMLDDREELVKNVFKYKDDAGVRLPVAFKHIINNVVGSMGLDAHSIVDISPLETFILVEEYYQKLEKLHYVRPTNLFRIMYFFYLNPRDLLCVKRYNKSALTVLLETVVLKYKQAIVNPGDMVGVIAGQSIGEPTTQLTLNSFVYETEILVRNSKGEIKCVQIGDFAKWGIDTSRKIDYMDDKDTTYAELCEFYEVPSATEEGLTVWRRIEAVTKHPVINEDGTNTMLKVTTKGQREIIATKAKSFLQLIDGKIVGVNGSELQVGDYLPVSKITYALSVSHGFIGDIYPIADIESNIIPNIINGETIMQDRDGRCSDIEFDQIVSIEEVPNTTPYAYDLTVEDTRNFDCMNGLCSRDTFHLSGVASKSNVTRGVPRIEEILNLTKSQKSTSLTVHLKQVDEQHMDRAVKYAKMLEHTKLSNVVKSMQICFDPSEDDTRIADDREFMRQFMEFEGMMQECGAEKNAAEKSKWVLRMEMDEETMLDKNITMDDVHFALKNSALGEDITCSYSDYNSDKLVFRIRSSTFGQSKKKNKNAPVSLDLSDDISMLRSYQDTILNSVMLRGVTGIVNVLPRKLQNMVDKEDGKYIRKDMWVLDTTGTNLLDTLALDYIDPYRTYSNDIKEVFRVLGIDAARQTIFDEMTDVMETSDVYINYHHLSLLCDRMTLTKGMVSIYRTGILSDDVGPIAKSTFEVHTKVLLDAARRAEFDHIRGVSANVMCGQQGFYGTNAFQVVLDMKEMAKLEDTLVDEGTDDVDKMMAEMGLGAADGCVSKIANNIRYLNAEKTGECKDDYDMGF